MSSDSKFSSEDKANIERLAKCAVSAANKEAAKPYISQLEAIRFQADLTRYVDGVFAELISSLKAASGRVREKDHWTQVAYSAMYKLTNFL